jgi:hypothetical protein
MDSAKVIEQDVIYQYSDGKQLLHQSLSRQRQLLQQLEHMARVSQGSTSSETIPEFPLARAQTLLFELYEIGDQVDILITEINRYAERCGKPGVKRTETAAE